MDQLHFRFEKHHEDERQIGNEVNQNGTERRQIGLGEKRADQISKRVERLARGDVSSIRRYPSISAEMAKANSVAMVMLKSDAG